MDDIPTGFLGPDCSMDGAQFGKDDLLPFIRRSERDLFTAEEAGALETRWIGAARLGSPAELVERAVRRGEIESSAGAGWIIGTRTATSSDAPTSTPGGREESTAHRTPVPPVEPAVGTVRAGHQRLRSPPRTLVLAGR